MLTESVKVVGNLEIKHLDADGSIKDIRQLKNLVVASGKDVITARLLGNSLPVMSHMAVGEGNTTAVSSQTSLSSEVDRVILTPQQDRLTLLHIQLLFPPVAVQVIFKKLVFLTLMFLVICYAVQHLIVL